MKLQQKKILMTVAACVGMMSVYAGGPEMMSAPLPAKKAFQPYLYTELGLGYAHTGYGNYYNSSAWTNTSNINDGLAYQGDIGFSFMPHMSAEVGLGMLPKAKYEVYDQTAGGQGEYVNASYKSWYGYLQGRVDASLKGKVGIFAKAGVAYRSITYDYNGNLNGSGLDDYYWGPIFGGGLTLPLKDDLYAMLEYSHLTGSSDSNEGASYPDSDLYLAKLGYRFTF